jgi:hypothetical protein
MSALRAVVQAHGLPIALEDRLLDLSVTGGVRSPIVIHESPG